MALKKLSFKEYIDSKQKLRNAIESIPKTVSEYEVRTYCKLVVGESPDEKEYIPLKPHNRIFVDWLHTDVDNPTPINLRFEGLVNVDPDDEKSPMWHGERLLKWLLRNTRETK